MRAGVRLVIVIPAAVLSVLLAAPRVVGADEPLAPALQLFQDARAEMKKPNPDYEVARAKLAESVRLDPTKVGVLLNLATCEEKLQKLQSARVHASAALTLAQSQKDEREQLARDTVARLDAAVPKTLTPDAAVVSANAEPTTEKPGEKPDADDEGEAEGAEYSFKRHGRDRVRVPVLLSGGYIADGNVGGAGTSNGLALCNFSGAAFSLAGGIRYAAVSWLDLVALGNLTYAHGSASLTPGGCGNSNNSQMLQGSSAELNAYTFTVDPSLRLRPWSGPFHFALGGRLGYMSSSGRESIASIGPISVTANPSASGVVGGARFGLGLTLGRKDSFEVGVDGTLLAGPWANPFGISELYLGWAF
jgi:hypothetical protein